MEIGDKVLYTDENGKSFDAEVTRVIDDGKLCSVLISGTTKSAELISQDSCGPAGSKPKKKEETGLGQDAEDDEEPKQAKSETPKEEANTEGKSTEESSDSN